MKSFICSFVSVLCFVCIALLPVSCDNDRLPEVEEPEFCDTLEVSYQLNIRPIVETYCAYSGCHDGSSPGVYLTYEGMLPNLNSGDVRERSINARDMPPSYANAGLEELPAEEFEMFQCWLEQGYPEQ